MLRARRWRRRITRSVLAIALGASTTIVIAWGLAFRGTQASGSGGYDFKGGGLTIMWRCSGMGASVFYRHEERYGTIDVGGPGTPESIEALVPWYFRTIALCTIEGEDEFGSRERMVDARGWPLLALYSWRNSVHVAEGERTGGIILPSGWDFSNRGMSPASDRVALPCIPIWVGLSANTALYSGVWWAGLLVLPGSRKRWRLRRGRCSHCDYDLNGTPGAAVCSECGK
jgi:hypothetical protein